MNRQAAVLLGAVLAAAALAREPDFRAFRFTRSGSDSIQFYYQNENPYQLGEMVVGGTEHEERNLNDQVAAAV